MDDDEETVNPWKLLYKGKQCSLDELSSDWNDWYKELGNSGFYSKIHSSSSHVVEKLFEKDCTSCLLYLLRLENDWKLSYEQFVHRLSYMRYNYKLEEFDIVTLAAKIKKDINSYIANARTDHVAVFLNGLRNFIRTNVSCFKKLGLQKDRTRISGIIYQLTAECGDSKLADICLMFGLKHYRPQTLQYLVIGDMIAYFLATYRILQQRRGQLGTELNLSAVHVSVMREDYHALAVIPFREEDLWRPAGLSDTIAVELSAYNAFVCPSKASILTFIICGIRNGLLDSAIAPVTWDDDVNMRVRVVQDLLVFLLNITELYQIDEVSLRSECFFNDTRNQQRVEGSTIDCTKYVSAQAIRSVWRLYKQSYTRNIQFNKNMAINFLMYDDDDKKRFKSLHAICMQLKYEGNVDHIRKSLRPQRVHYCGKLMDIETCTLIPFTDNRLLFRCGVFRGAFRRLAYNANGACGVISPHCLFDVSDIYTFMTMLNMLDSDECLNSFIMECRDAKRQLTGNSTRSEKKYH